MIIIVALDESDGMCFNHRRQSRDRLLCERILSLTAGGRLLMNAYSARLFGEGAAVEVSEAFLDEAAEGDYCFVEDRPLAEYADRIEKIIAYKWNRAYPSDLRLDIELSVWNLESSSEFEGSSHPVITEEIYTK